MVYKEDQRLTEKTLEDYLLQYGYLQKPLEGAVDFRLEDITEALRAFQEASQLPVSGQMDDGTRARMKQPRCGLEDPFNQKTFKYLLLGRWRKKHLTFRILNLPSTLSPSRARAALLQAFKYWSSVAPLTFREVKAGWADIRLSFHGRQSTYCSNTFDGPGKVLAHADIPELGSVHFDKDEFWTEGTYQGVNLRIIAAHEVGHALGLGHSRYTQALMAPVYAGYQPYFKLHPDDVAGIQALYGKKSPETEDEEEEISTVSLVTTKPSPMPNPCNSELDATMLGPRGKTYAFKGDYVWTVTDSGPGPLFRVSALWEGLPGNLDAAVYSPRTRWIHFFKGVIPPPTPFAVTPPPISQIEEFSFLGKEETLRFRGTSGPSVDPEKLSFSGLRDSTETAPNGTRCLTEHSGPKYTQPPNPAHWSDPSHGPPRGPGPPKEGGYPDESEASSEESGVDQELFLSRDNETGYQEDGSPSFLSIPSACNCQGSPGVPEGTYSEEGDGSSSNFCHHCTSPALGEDEELEEYDDEEPFKFPSDFSRVSSGKKPPSRRQRHRFLTKEDTRDSGRRDPRSPGRHRLGRKRNQADKRRGLGLWRGEGLCQLGQAGFWWLIELLVLVGDGRYCQPEEEVTRLVTMAGVPEDELNPFHVLGVEATASDTELKKAYRQLAVMVHPDKNHHPRAEEAFKVLRAAWDIVSNPERRKEYEMKRMAENELSRSVNEFLSKLQDDLKEAMNTMMCSRCQGKH
ncbi:hypothetical protein STEG23_026540, partial [Scotinomys teguina]